MDCGRADGPWYPAVSLPLTPNSSKCYRSPLTLRDRGGGTAAQNGVQQRATLAAPGGEPGISAVPSRTPGHCSCLRGSAARPARHPAPGPGHGHGQRDQARGAGDSGQGAPTYRDTCTARPRSAPSRDWGRAEPGGPRARGSAPPAPRGAFVPGRPRTGQRAPPLGEAAGEGGCRRSRARTKGPPAAPPRARRQEGVAVAHAPAPAAAPEPSPTRLVPALTS